MAYLEVREIRKHFGETQVLKGISLALDKGEFLVLLGPSGCGKSTLLNMIAGLDSITDGEIAIDGQVMNAVAPKNRDIAMVFQSYALYPNMTVKKNISFGLEMRGVPAREREQLIDRTAKLLQIDHLLHRKPAQLSGGQRQRVAMGRALVRDPKIFLFDEPLSNLDAKLRVDMRTEIKKLHHRLGTTIVYVTHDQIEAMTLATQIAVMRAGVIEQLASPQDVYEQPANMYVGGFVGSPPMNFVPATLVRHGNGVAVRFARIADGSSGDVELPLPEAPDRLTGWVDREVVFGLRPEALTDWSEAEASIRPHAHAFDCRVDVLEPTGADTLTYLELGGTNAIARVNPRRTTKPGDTMHLMADMSQACLFDPASEVRI
jgi:multiple sugar transport system ATP-binding protein